MQFSKKNSGINSTQRNHPKAGQISSNITCLKIFVTTDWEQYFRVPKLTNNPLPSGLRRLLRLGLRRRAGLGFGGWLGSQLRSRHRLHRCLHCGGDGALRRCQGRCKGLGVGAGTGGRGGQTVAWWGPDEDVAWGFWACDPANGLKSFVS